MKHTTSVGISFFFPGKDLPDSDLGCKYFEELDVAEDCGWNNSRNAHVSPDLLIGSHRGHFCFSSSLGGSTFS